MCKSCCVSACSRQRPPLKLGPMCFRRKAKYSRSQATSSKIGRVVKDLIQGVELLREDRFALAVWLTSMTGQILKTALILGWLTLKDNSEYTPGCCALSASIDKVLALIYRKCTFHRVHQNTASTARSSCPQTYHIHLCAATAPIRFVVEPL